MCNCNFGFAPFAILGFMMKQSLIGFTTQCSTIKEWSADLKQQWAPDCRSTSIPKQQKSFGVKVMLQPVAVKDKRPDLIYFMSDCDVFLR